MDNNYASRSNSSIKTKDLVITALLIALVYAATNINVPSPIPCKGGLVHLGNIVLFTAAIVFGPKKGAIAGAFGMGLFDLLSPWTIWAPFTFVVRGVMGFLVGYIAHMNKHEGNSMKFNILGMLAGSIFMIPGYYVSEIILYGNWIAPVYSIPGDISQILIGMVVAVPLSAALKKARIA